MKARTKKALLFAGGVVGGAALAFWYARKHIDRRWPLHPALEATRHAFDSRTLGRVSYYEDASGDGTPVLLVHSVNAAASAFEMRPIFEALRGRQPVFAVDLPGFGFSERSERTYSRELYADVIAELLERISAEHGPVDVVALSLSSEFAARAALQSESRVRSLTLISPTGFSKRSERNALQRANAEERSESRHRAIAFPATAQLLFDALSSRPSIRYFLKKSFAGPVDEGLVEYAYATAHQPDARHAPLWFLSGALFDPDVVSQAYEKLEMPVHVLYDQDAHVGFEQLERTMRRCAPWRATRIAPTRGLPHIERTSETLDAMSDFFRYVDDLSSDRPTLQLGTAGDTA